MIQIEVSKLWRLSKRLGRKLRRVRNAETAAPGVLPALSASDPRERELETAMALVRQLRPDLVLAPRFLIPSARKLYDFRQELGFGQIAGETLAQGRTLLDYNRLFTLWQAVQNSWH